MYKSFSITLEHGNDNGAARFKLVVKLPISVLI